MVCDPIELFDAESLQDPYPLYNRLRAAGPVGRIGDSEFYAVSSWDAVVEAITRVDEFSSNLTATMVYQPTARSRHSPWRPSAIRPRAGHRRRSGARCRTASCCSLIWRPRRSAPWRGSSPRLPNGCGLDGLRDGRIEWMGAVANRLPMMVVARLIGVPEADVDKLIEWGYAGTQLLEGLVSADQLAAAAASVMELGGYITDHFARAAANPQDNLLGDLAAACAAGELDDVAALSMMITLFAAGGESTASLLGSAAWILATRPDIQQQVRENPELLGAFIDETLRYEPPFRGHYRHVAVDTTLCGTELRAGSHLLLLWGAANRDPAHFHAPTSSGSTAPAAKDTSPSGKGRTFASAPRSRAWKHGRATPTA